MSYLDELLASTRLRAADARAVLTDEILEQRIAGRAPARSLRDALTSDDVVVIAEIKRASPAKGSLAPDLDARRTAEAYAAGGAAAISVLTEPDRFLGSLEDLEHAAGTGLPVLRKDFILDEFQILESRAWGADSVLLIVRVLGDELDRLIRAARALGMEPLVEVFDEEEVERALTADATVIGINHRDLATFAVDPERTAKLAPSIPQDRLVVGLSGVRTRADVEELATAGARAVLVGEALVTAIDPVATLKELTGR